MKNKNVITLVIVVLVTLTMFSCAANEVAVNCVYVGHTYGFWGGLWHGMIAPFDFVGMLIWDDVVVYAPNNNGGWYAFGFVLGVGGFSVGASKSNK